MEQIFRVVFSKNCSILFSVFNKFPFGFQEFVFCLFVFFHPRKLGHHFRAGHVLKGTCKIFRYPTKIWATRRGVSVAVGSRGGNKCDKPSSSTIRRKLLPAARVFIIADLCCPPSVSSFPPPLTSVLVFTRGNNFIGRWRLGARRSISGRSGALWMHRNRIC